MVTVTMQLDNMSESSVSIVSCPKLMTVHLQSCARKHMSAGLLLVVETRWAFLIEETYEHYFLYTFGEYVTVFVLFDHCHVKSSL